MVFVFDTCSIIAGWEEIYCVQNFPQLWNKIEEIIENGDIYIPDVVFDELNILTENTRIENNTFAWAQGFRRAVHSSHSVDEQRLENDIARLVSAYPNLARHNQTDYAVVAAATQLDGTVVTQEQANRSTQTAQNKIPTVCQRESIPCVNFFGLIRHYNWVF